MHFTNKYHLIIILIFNIKQIIFPGEGEPTFREMYEEITETNIILWLIDS